MTFGQPRFRPSIEWELIRLCSAKQVVGGTERLFKAFVKEHAPASIISYCDLSKFDGTIYEKLGFVYDNVTYGMHLHNPDTGIKFAYDTARRHGPDRLLGTSLGGNPKDNIKLMKQLGYLLVYDAGQASYIWRSNS
jgi:hypothetical protein